MRVKHIACFAKALAHGFANLVVAVGSTADQAGNALVGSRLVELAVFAIEIDDAGKV